MRPHPLVVVLCLLLAGCGCTCNPDKCRIDQPVPANIVLPIQRCTADSQCSSGSCDLETRGCRTTCGATVCAIDQLAVGRDAECKCVNLDGIGSPCTSDQECTQATPFGSVTRQICQPLASPIPGGPGRVCVPEQTCDSGPNACLDPDPGSAAVGGECVALGTAPLVSCSSKCTVQQGPNEVVTHCRFDEVATMVGMECRCLPRPDPFGQPCTDDASCAWPSGTPAGNAGPARVCKITAPGARRCVPGGFCRPETAATCHDKIDDDCDGIDESNEPECQVEYCADLDDDGYCGACLPPRYETPPGYKPRAACQAGSEPSTCDAAIPGNDRRHPGVPEACNGVDDNCDTMGNVDEGCQRFCWDADGDGLTRREGAVDAVELPSGPRGQWLTCSNLWESASCDERPELQRTEECPARQCQEGETQPCTDGCTQEPSVRPCVGGAWGECKRITYIERTWNWDDPKIGHRCGYADTDGWIADWSRDRNCHMTFGPYVRGTGPGHVVAVKGWTFGRSDLHFDIVSQQGGNVLAARDVTVEKKDGNGFFCLKSTLNLPCGEEIEARIVLRGGNSVKIYATRISPILKPVTSDDDGCPGNGP